MKPEALNPWGGGRVDLQVFARDQPPSRLLEVGKEVAAL